LIRQPLAIDPDLFGGRVNPRSQLGHHLPVNLHASGKDQLLARSAAADPGGSQYLLQSLAMDSTHGRVRRSSGG
jgi:hypothetical protein